MTSSGTWRRLSAAMAAVSVLALAGGATAASAATTPPTSVTYAVECTYLTTPKGSSPAKTDMSVAFTNAEGTSLYGEVTAIVLPSNDSAEISFEPKMVEVASGATRTLKKVLAYQGQNLTVAESTVSEFRIESSLGDQFLTELAASVAQPCAQYYGGATAAGVKIVVKHRATCTIQLPVKPGRTCAKRTESLTVSNVGATSARVSLKSTISGSGLSAIRLPAQTQSIRQGSSWKVDFMRLGADGSIKYFGQLRPGYYSSSYALKVGSSSTAGGKYGPRGADVPAWWKGVRFLSPEGV